MLALDVAMFGKVWNKFVIGDAAGLGKAVHAFVDFNIDIAFVDKGGKVVLLKDGLWDQGDREHHVFGTIEVGVQVEILNVHGHKQGVGSGNDAVKDEFGGGKASGFGAGIARVVDEIATDGPSDTLGLGF